MNELRIILLIAGVLLIVGLYVWGMRGRTRSGGTDTRKPAVFTGTADSFEKESPPLEDEPSVAVESSRMEVSRRIEPSLSGDTTSGTHATPSRREPTWSDHDDGVTAGRSTGQAGDARIEPSFESSLDHAPETDFDTAGEPEIQQQAPPSAPKRPSQKIVAMRVNAVAPARLDGGRLKQTILTEGLEFGRYDIFHRLHADGRPVFSVASLREPGTFDLDAMPSTQYPGVALFVVLPGPVAAAEAIDEMVFTARALAAQLGGSLADDRGVPLTPLRVGQLREDALEFERGAGTA